MESLGINPSAETVADEIEFHQVLLATLDPQSFDYNEEKAKLERQLREMNAYMASKRAQTSQPRVSSSGLSAGPFDTHGFSTLPSSSSRGQQSGYERSRKRPREDSLGGSMAAAAFHRVHRPRSSSSTFDSSTTSPGSPDSLDEATQLYERESLRRQRLEQQRLQEERFRQQREDAEIAKKMAEGTWNAGFNAATAHGSHSQSYLNSSGHISRPTPYEAPTARSVLPENSPSTAAPLYNYNPAQALTAFDHPSSSSHQYEQSNRLDPANYRTQTSRANNGRVSTVPDSLATADPFGYGSAESESPFVLLGSRHVDNNPFISSVSTDYTAQANRSAPSVPSLEPRQTERPWYDADDSTTDDSSEPEIISREQYRTGTGRSAPDRHYQMPGSFPWAAHDQQMRPYPYTVSQPIRPGQNNYGAPPGPSQSRRADWMTSLINAGQSFVSGASSGQFPGLPWTGDSEADDWRRTLYRNGIGYAGNDNVDPAKIKEDIDNLLKNIRPDEDLPLDQYAETPKAMATALMIHQRAGLTWLKNQEEGSNKGCILADDMGLGKTIQALALILARPSDNPAVKTTLIVAPVALLKQWKDEIDEKVKPGHKLRTFIYHGQVNTSWQALASYDVVITTLGKVAVELKRKEERDTCRSQGQTYRQRNKRDQLVLFADQCKFYRVIIDEAQSIKNKSTRSAQAACLLQAKHRLCMTGTPMMNNVGEMYSLIHFLRIPPYNSFEKFQRDIGKPITKDSTRESAMRVLQVLLRTILLRRTKKSSIKHPDGIERPILQLPPRTTEIVHAVFDKEQQEFYDALEKQTAMKANRFLQSGHIGRNYASILVLLLRLRQACDHPHMIKDFDTPEGTNMSDQDMTDLAAKFSEAAISMIKDAQGAFECPVCYDVAENPTIFFPCGHDVCAECFAKITDPSQAIAAGDDNYTAKCPECRCPIKADKIITYNTFKKVHMRDEYMSDMVGLPEDEKSSDDESETEEESDADSQGDLRDFIVNDDEEDEDEEVDAEDGQDTARDDDDGCKSASSSMARKKSKASSKGKAKAKARPVKNNKKTLAQLKKEGQRNASAKRKYIRRLEKNFVTSAKIDRTMEILADIEKNSPGEKSIIFSQFTSFLDLLEVPISRAGIGYKRYDGSMSSKEREFSIDKFKGDPQIKVMLISLRAGNAGLNLTAASQVIILDPFWNPFVEDQAIDRAHRIGQQREVKVHRILCENTVEDRIVALQERKRELINEALDEKAGQQLSRLGVNQLRYLFNMAGGSID